MKMFQFFYCLLNTVTSIEVANAANYINGLHDFLS